MERTSTDYNINALQKQIREARHDASTASSVIAAKLKGIEARLATIEARLAGLEKPSTLQRLLGRDKQEAANG